VHEAEALGVEALGAAVLGAAVFGVAEFIIYLELWGGGGHMGDISTKYNAVSNKLCLLLYARRNSNPHK
jgi:hypothetical protein